MNRKLFKFFIWFDLLPYFQMHLKKSLRMHYAISRFNLGNLTCLAAESTIYIRFSDNEIISNLFTCLASQFSKGKKKYIIKMDRD